MTTASSSTASSAASSTATASADTGIKKRTCCKSGRTGTSCTFTFTFTNINIINIFIMMLACKHIYTCTSFLLTSSARPSTTKYSSCASCSSRILTPAFSLRQSSTRTIRLESQSSKSSKSRNSTRSYHHHFCLSSSPWRRNRSSCLYLSAQDENQNSY